MKISKYNLIFGVLTMAILIAVVSIITLSKPAHAALGLQFDATNKLAPSTVAGYGSTSTATSSSVWRYLAPGAATTTLLLNTANIDQIAMNLQLVSTTSVPTLKWRIEYSSNAVDWYGDDAASTAQATSTTMVLNNAFTDFAWTFSASTGGTSDSTHAFKHVVVPLSPSPFARIVFSDAVGAGVGAFTAQLTLKTTNPI